MSFAPARSATAVSILIVGAGPSGLTLATELNRRGIPCTIIDKATGPAPLSESRALAFNARSQAILAPSGVAGKITDAGHAIASVRLCWRGALRREVAIHTGPPAAPQYQLTTIRQGNIERLLIDHCLLYTSPSPRDS